MSSDSRKGAKWSRDEVCALLDLWIERDNQQQLNKYHSKCVYDVISQRLRRRGIARSGEQCREKIKKMKIDYKCLVCSDYPPAFAKSARRLLGFYDRVHEIFGKRFVAKPNSIIESLALNGALKDDSAEDNEIVWSRAAVADDSTEDKTNSTSDSEEIIDSNSNNEFFNFHMSSGLKHKLTRTKTSLKTQCNTSFQYCDMNSFRKHLESLTCSMVKRQESLHQRFVELERRRFKDELAKETQRLLVADEQRRVDQEREMKLLEALLGTLTNSDQTNCFINTGLLKCSDVSQ